MGLFGDDIHLCPSGGDILLCLERDIEVCTTCEALALEGDNDCDVGEIYTATGGSGSLTFTFDSGTISTTETTCTILTIDSCTAGSSRIGTISVADECSTAAQTASIRGRLPDGEWVWDSDIACTSSSTTENFIYYLRNGEFLYCYAVGLNSTYADHAVQRECFDCDIYEIASEVNDGDEVVSNFRGIYCISHGALGSILTGAYTYNRIQVLRIAKFKWVCE